MLHHVFVCSGNAAYYVRTHATIHGQTHVGLTATIGYSITLNENVTAGVQQITHNFVVPDVRFTARIRYDVKLSKFVFHTSVRICALEKN
jgi:hypothetical protein